MQIYSPNLQVNETFNNFHIQMHRLSRTRAVLGLLYKLARSLQCCRNIDPVAARQVVWIKTYPYRFKTKDEVTDKGYISTWLCSSELVRELQFLSKWSRVTGETGKQSHCNNLITGLKQNSKDNFEESQIIINVEKKISASYFIKRVSVKTSCFWIILLIIFVYVNIEFKSCDTKDHLWDIVSGKEENNKVTKNRKCNKCYFASNKFEWQSKSLNKSKTLFWIFKVINFEYF